MPEPLRGRRLAELVNATDDSQIWGEQISESTANVSMVQQDIVRDISDKLRMKLSPAQRQQIDQAKVENPDAYRLYLLGRYQFDRFDPAGFAKAVDYFRQAISNDPGSAAAHAGLANKSVEIGTFSTAKTAAEFATGQTEAEEALALDPNLEKRTWPWPISISLLGNSPPPIPNSARQNSRTLIS
jgi:adenylate cyclase